MRHITLAAVAATTLLAMAGTATAQDWSGPYIGLSAGGAVADDDEDERVVFDTNLDGNFNDTVRTTGGVDAFGPTTANPGGFCNGKASANNFAAGCTDDDNVKGDFAVRVGWDFQSGPWVYGLVAEAAAVDVEDFNTAFSITPAAYQFNREIEDVVYAARLRGGYAFGRTLAYVTGGAAFAKVTDSYFTTNAVNSFTPLVSEQDATGYQAGFGVETWLNDRITVGAEYLYTSLDADEGLTVRTGPGTAPPTNPFLIVNPAGTDQRRTNDELAYHGFRVTLSARF
ncbi:outer membrane protein [Brevundimonas sp.]|uniref:outer membrane protein n=1 Tax=Brevundimonas sp. TaxID=1871086 RepID=UPI0035B38478